MTQKDEPFDLVDEFQARRARLGLTSESVPLLINGVLVRSIKQAQQESEWWRAGETHFKVD